MDRINTMLGLREISIERVLNFLPYPFLVSEQRDKKQLNLFVNKEFIKEIGFTISEIPTINEWFEKAYPDENYRNEIITRWAEQFDKQIQNGDDFAVLRAKIHTVNHGEQWYEVKAFILGNIQLVAFVNINDEIEKEEELEQLNENKNRILSILSHDLRAPLANLQSLIELSAIGGLSLEDYSSSMKSVGQMTSQLQEFLNTTLLWTRANFDKIEPSISQVHVPKVISEITSLLEKSLVEKGIEIKRFLKADAGVYSDEEIISIVFRNVLSNAIKFTASGTITIRSFRDENNFVIEVIDTGVGMTVERLDSVMSGKYKSKEGTNKEKGLGIGLKLCQDLLSKIGGHLQIMSELNKGTTTRIILENQSIM